MEMNEAVADTIPFTGNDTKCDARDAKITDLEARIGRQAMLIEALQGALSEANSNYRNLIANVSRLLSGEVTLDRFKILEDGLTWQVLALPIAEPEPAICQLRPQPDVCVISDVDVPQ